MKTLQKMQPDQSIQNQEDILLLVNTIADYGIFLLDPHGNVLTWNLGAARITGYETAEILGQHFSTFYSVEDLENEKPQKELQIADETGRYEEEGWRLRKDGTKFWANILITALKDPNGKLRGFGKVTRDLTERRIAQQRYKLIVENVIDYAIFMIDASGKIQSWNAGAQHIKGYSTHDVIGTHFSRFYTKEDRDRGHPAKELNIAAQMGRYEEEGWRVKKNGTQFWASVVITSLRDEDGKLVGFAKVTRDLTERRIAEQKLKESEEGFRLMIDSVKDYAILMLDPKGFVISWNSGAEHIKGWKPQEIIGRHFSLFYRPEDVKAEKPKHELETASREGRFEDIGWRVRKDGTLFWANVIITVLRDDKGNLRGFAKVTRDITEKKKAEEDLKNAYQDLENRVIDRTQALTMANRELESFSYSISHDLRAPLRSMDGFSQALLKYYPDKLDDRGKDFLRRIRESAQRMGHLIEDILILSKLGRTDLHKSSVNLSAMAEKIAAELKMSDPTRNVEFTIAPELMALCDATLIHTALENLIGNAWKYTSTHPNAHIQFGVAPSNNSKNPPVYFIKDDGAGFDMSFADKLFGVFQRLHSEKEFPGTGIGLASVKRIIQRHSGEVWAESEIEKGSTFYFTLRVQNNQS